MGGSRQARGVVGGRVKVQKRCRWPDAGQVRAQPLGETARTVGEKKGELTSHRQKCGEGTESGCTRELASARWPDIARVQVAGWQGESGQEFQLGRARVCAGGAGKGTGGRAAVMGSTCEGYCLPSKPAIMPIKPANPHLQAQVWQWVR